MVEHIVEAPSIDEFGGYFPVHERIVRCRDCKYHINKTCKYRNGISSESNCFFFSDYEGVPMPVEPDGFCAWGERREGE